MRNEKKIKELTPKMTIIYYRDNERKQQNYFTKFLFLTGTFSLLRCLIIMNNNNTLTKKGITIMDFDNGIFRTVADETRKGIVWVVRVANGEKITFCRTQADVDFCIAELMTQRLAR